MGHPPEPPSQPPPPPPPEPAPGRDGQREALLRSTVVRPSLAAPDPVDSVFVANRLTTLTHDLANLLDGSLRVVSLARRSINRTDTQRSGPAGPSAEESTLDQLSRQLDTLHAAMQHMAELVKASMLCMSGGPGITGPRLPFGSTSSLQEAVSHAVEVMRPFAEERRIRLDVDTAPDLNDLTAGPIYTVVANAVRNSIESIERRATGSGGLVRIRARTEPAPARPRGRDVVLEVIDDGVGPPPSTPGRADDVFRLGFTTKPAGSGLGLALSLDVVHQLGGTIALEPVRDAAGRTAGAVLRVRYPAPPSHPAPTAPSRVSNDPARPQG